MSRRVLSTAAVAIAIGLTATPSAPAATPATLYAPFATPNPEPQAGARWGERLVAASDENGDGVNDFFMATPFVDLSYPDQGRVYLMSGKTRAILRVIDAPEPQGGTAFGFSATGGASFGFYISVPGDLNGDGKDDVVVGTDAQNVYSGPGPPCGAPEPNGCNEGQGEAWAFSGASGAILRVFNNPDPQGAPGNNARFGSRIGRAGDVTGDGVPDIIIGASNNDVPAGCGDVSVGPGCRKNQGQAYIFNGATGALVRTLNLPDPDQPATTCSSSCGSFGISVQGPGDTNGDSIPDQLVDAGSYSRYTGSGGACGTPEPNGCNESQGREYILSGADGSLLQRIDDPVAQANATFGFQDVAPLSPGDINGDGFADVYANGFIQDGPTGTVGEGRAWVFDGKTGALLRSLVDPSPEVGGQFGWSMSRTNYNGDSTPDMYVGQSPHHVAGATESGGTYVFDGRDGSLLKPLELPPGDRQAGAAGNVGPALGWGNAAPGDLNGDGDPDYLAGAPFFDEAGLQDNGRIYAFMSSHGTSGTPAAGTQIVQTALPRVKIIGVTAKVKPRRDRRAPYRFTVSGRVRLPAGVDASACADGRMLVEWKAGATTAALRRQTLKSGCGYRLRATFRSKRKLGSGRLKVKVTFLGSDRLKPASARTQSVRAG